MLAGIRQQLEARVAAITAASHSLLLQRRSQLEQLAGRLEALSPMAILDRGYALVFDASGKLLKDAAKVSAGDEISVRLARGEIRATVKKSKT